MKGGLLYVHPSFFTKLIKVNVEFPRVEKRVWAALTCPCVLA